VPRVCTVCVHPDRPTVDMALVNRRPFRTIADQFRVSKTALIRHHDDHLPATLATAQADQEGTQAIDLMAELKRCFERVNLLFDACHDWLKDPDDPNRYTLGPRAEDVQVIYSELVGDKVVQKKARLSALLAKLEDARVDVQRGEIRHADPRELILKTAGRLQGHLEMLVKLRETMELAERVAHLEAATPVTKTRGRS
jgi:hypothetical protein